MAHDPALLPLLKDCGRPCVLTWGVDNTDLGATQTPGLTNVRTPIVEIGIAAGAQLVARLEGRPFVAQQLLPFELVQRGSTAAPGHEYGARGRQAGRPTEG